MFGSFDYRIYSKKRRGVCLKVRGDKELSLLRYYFPYLTELTSFEFDYSKAAASVRFFSLTGGGAYSGKHYIVSYYRSESFVAFEFNWLGGVSMHKGSSA